MKAAVLVRIQPRQPLSIYDLRITIYEPRREIKALRKSSFVNPKFLTLGSEIASRLAYTQQSEGQNLPERPAFDLSSYGSAGPFASWRNQERAGL